MQKSKTIEKHRSPKPRKRANFSMEQKWVHDRKLSQNRWKDSLC